MAVKYKRLIQDDEDTKKPKKKYPRKKYPKEKKFKYSDFEYDKEGFAEAKKYKPDKFDLVEMQIERRGVRGRIIAGWWTGCAWYSSRLLPGDIVICWSKPHIYRSID